MINFFKITSLFFLLYSFFLSHVFADYQNNKFGIGVLQPETKDIENIKKLVNSSNGDWGYVTLVIQENDKNTKKWQEIFDNLRKNHLIPIVRLSTKPDGDYWKAPIKEDINSWLDFLNSLNWVVKRRYVILFNEPNHALEWGGKVDPQSFKEIIISFSKALKQSNNDYFIMMAGFDQSAPNSYPNYLDEYTYLQQIVDKKLFEDVDGWASHSYPNPGFIGGVYDFGKKSIRGYLWELDFLKELGIDKKLPVFITETGWPHKENCDGRKSSYYTADQVAGLMEKAFSDIWLRDENVEAVTPFIFNYQGGPFDNFSWVKPGGDGFYPQYFAIEKISKIKGEIEQVEKPILKSNLPKVLTKNSNYYFQLKIENTGQSIFDSGDGYKLVLQDNSFDYIFSNLDNIEPKEDGVVNLFIKTGDKLGKFSQKVLMQKNNKQIADLVEWNFEVATLPEMKIKVDLFLNVSNKGSDFEVQLFDKNENLVYKAKKVNIEKGIGALKDIKNIVIGDKYRVVILKPYYLPRQTHIVFEKNGNTVQFKSMLPFDFNKDGKFSIDDLFCVFK